MGHGDMIVVADCGLPVPQGVPCIDLAVTLGVPGFFDVLDAILGELKVERAVIASEASGELQAAITTRIGTTSVDHETFKAQTAQARAIVRTGEATPYANIALYSGVVF